MKKFALILLAALTAAMSMAQVPSKDELLAKALAEAKETNKNVMVKFSASWCGWCHRFSDYLKTPSGKKVADQYIIVTLTVMENGDKVKEENAGGEEYMKELGLDGMGIPSFAILSPQGKVLITSNAAKKDEPKKNIGYPVTRDEINHFLKVLKLTSKLSAEDIASVDAALWEIGKPWRG